MINKAILIGNVGQDPEIRYTGDVNNGAKVATFRLATTERYRDRNGNLQEHTEWHNIVVWRNTADVVEKYVKKGTQVYICQPTLVFLPGEPHGQRSLVGYSPWGHRVGLN